MIWRMSSGGRVVKEARWWCVVDMVDYDRRVSRMQ